MDVLGDLVARDRRSGRPALHAVGGDRTLSYRNLCNTAYKTGNILRYLGVDRGGEVVVAAASRPEPVLAFLGATQLGAATRVVEADALADASTAGDARVVVAPVDREPDLDLPPNRSLLAYGGSSARPETVRWEEAVWSENPAFPPTPVEADAIALADGDGMHSHATVLAAADSAVEALSLDANDRVAVRASLADPRTVAAGVVGPLSAGATVVLPTDDADDAVGADDTVDATAAVVAGDVPMERVPEAQTVWLGDVPV